MVALFRPWFFNSLIGLLRDFCGATVLAAAAPLTVLGDHWLNVRGVSQRLPRMRGDRLDAPLHQERVLNEKTA